MKRGFLTPSNAINGSAVCLLPRAMLLSCPVHERVCPAHSTSSKSARRAAVRVLRFLRARSCPRRSLPMERNIVAAVQRAAVGVFTRLGFLFLQATPASRTRRTKLALTKLALAKVNPVSVCGVPRIQLGCKAGPAWGLLRTHSSTAASHANVAQQQIKLLFLS